MKMNKFKIEVNSTLKQRHEIELSFIGTQDELDELINNAQAESNSIDEMIEDLASEVSIASIEGSITDFESETYLEEI